MKKSFMAFFVSLFLFLFVGCGGREEKSAPKEATKKVVVKI